MYSAERLKSLIQDSNYTIAQSNGQRIYGLRYKVREQPKGSELFIGKLPRDMFEDELVPLFSQIAPIFELRLMVDFLGNNRGYCFVRYFTREAAETAIRRLNHYEVRPRCSLGVYWSLDNTRLFVGGIPKNKTKHEIMNELGHYIDDIKDVIMYPSYDDRTQNRGYVFLEFENHRAAAIGRRRIPPGSIIWNAPIKVDWADPLPEPDSEIMSKVATLYMRNIPTFLTNEEFERKLRGVIKSGMMVKVHKSFDYAFVHFVSRAAAEECMRTLQGFTICKQTIEITWARPQTYSSKFTKNITPNHYCMSLPAKSRWLIKKKNLQRRPMSEKSSDCDDFNSESSTPLFVFPRDQQIVEQYVQNLHDAAPSSSSHDYHDFIHFN